jgi:hypothetical protein
MTTDQVVAHQSFHAEANIDSIEKMRSSSNKLGIWGIKLPSKK